MTASIRERVEQSWAILESPTSRGEFESRELPDMLTPQGPVVLAVEAGSARHLLVPVHPDEDIRPDQKSRAVHLTRKVLLDGGTRRAFVDIRCNIPRLHRIFSQLATAVVERLLSVAGPSAAVCSEVLAEWRELVEFATRDVTEATIIGAFGELWQLSHLVSTDPSAVGFWRGPEHYPQDIIGPGGALEIKSRIVRNRTVRINSLTQLADPGLPLVLVVQSLARHEGGQTLGELLDTMVLRGADRSLLLDKLGLLGIEVDAGFACERRYIVEDEAAFLVDDDFPRLTPADVNQSLKPAIVRVTYELDTTQLAAWRLNPADFVARRSEIIG